MFPSGMSLPIAKRGSVVDEVGAGPIRRARSRADVARAPALEIELQKTPRETDRPHERCRLVAGFDDPVDRLRIAAVLDVIGSPGSALERVLHADRARDHGTVARLDRPSSPLPADRLVCAHYERQQVAVAAKPRPQTLAETREVRAVLQEEERGPDGPAAEDEPVGGDRPLGERRAARLALDRFAVVDVADCVASAWPRSERLRLASRSDVHAVAQLREREVVEVECVLRPVVAAEVALAAEPAGQPGAPVQVLLAADDRYPRHGCAAVRGERHRELREVPLEPELLCGLAQRVHLVRPARRAGARAGTASRRASPRGVVVRLEILVADRPVLPSAVLEVLAYERRARPCG